MQTLNKARLIIRNLTPEQKKGIIAGTLSLATIGTGLAMFKFLPQNTSDTAENTEVTILPTEAKFSKINSDDKSFQEAFDIARNDIGEGGYFEWKGNTYNTYKAEEWECLTPSEKDNYINNVAAATNKTNETKADDNIDIAIAYDEASTSKSADNIDNSNIEAETTILINHDYRKLDNGTAVVMKDYNRDGVSDSFIQVEDTSHLALGMVDTDFDGDYDHVLIENINTHDSILLAVDEGSEIECYPMDSIEDLAVGFSNAIANVRHGDDANVDDSVQVIDAVALNSDGSIQDDDTIDAQELSTFELDENTVEAVEISELDSTDGTADFDQSNDVSINFGANDNELINEEIHPDVSERLYHNL